MRRETGAKKSGIRVKVSVTSASFRFGFGGIPDRLRLVSVNRFDPTEAESAGTDSTELRHRTNTEEVLRS